MSLHVFMTRIPSLTLQIIKSRKRLALIPTISSAIVTFSKPSDVIQSRAIQTNDQISWLSQLIEALRTLIRSIQMTIIVAPLILSAPCSFVFNIISRNVVRFVDKNNTSLWTSVC